MRRIFLYACFILNAFSFNRLPQAIDDEICDLLQNTLKDDEFEMKRQSSNIDRKAYRLCHSKRYDVEKIYDPVTMEQKERIVNSFKFSLKFV